MRARNDISCRFLRFFVLALSALAFLNAARADIQNPPRAHSPGERRLQRRGEGPAGASAQKVEVAQGGTVEITLKAFGQQGRNIDFIIQSLPAHGTVTQPVQQTHSEATVTYTHRADDPAKTDEFTFSVQAKGSALSAPETVTLQIRDAAPSLVASPPELDFGAVTAGETTHAEITLENRGGGEATGLVEPPAPWVVDGPADYRLPRGASMTFQIVFKPIAERSYTDAIHFHHEVPGGGGVRLIGTGLARPGEISTRVATAAATFATRASDGTLLDGADGSPVGPGNRTAANPTTKPPTLPNASGPNARVASATIPGIPTAIEEHDGRMGSPTLSGLGTTPVVVNEAQVKQFEVRSLTASTMDLTWKPPVPKPHTYRVEMQYLVEEDRAPLRLDWRPYAQVELHPTPGLVTAHVTGLSANQQYIVRIVSVDEAGRLAAGSPQLLIYTRTSSHWWQPSLAKVLWLLLIVCGAMLIRRKLEDRAILQEIDDSRARAQQAEHADLRW